MTLSNDRPGADPGDARQTAPEADPEAVLSQALRAMAGDGNRPSTSTAAAPSNGISLTTAQVLLIAAIIGLIVGLVAGYVINFT